MARSPSSLLKYILVVCVISVLLTLWVAGPEQNPAGATWRKLLQEWEMRSVNQDELFDEFGKLNSELNHTYSMENKTLEQIYHYVLAMRDEVPVNPHKFKYIINPTQVCAPKDVFLLVYIHSAPAHHKRRMAIRQTWGNAKHFPDLVLRLVFLMGMPKDRLSEEALQMESDMYGDIVQEDFIDSYRNLTFKGIMGLKWATLHCQHARFVLKSDDDIFVNIFHVINHLKSLEKHDNRTKELLLCLVWSRMKVIRDSKSKWYLSPKEFKDDYFPTYCSGSAFMMTTDVIANMYNTSLYTPFFWVDDFYVTGLLAQKVGVVHQRFNSVYYLSSAKFFAHFTENDRWRTLTFGHVHDLNQWNKVWNLVLNDSGGQVVNAR